MKIDLLAGGTIATLELKSLREGRVEVIAERFDENIGAMPLGRGIMEPRQLKQLAREALLKAGEEKLAKQIPRFNPWWRE